MCLTPVPYIYARKDKKMNVKYINKPGERKKVTLGSKRINGAFSPMKMPLGCQKSTVFGRTCHIAQRLCSSKRLLASLVAISILAALGAWIATVRRSAPASGISPIARPDRYERATIFERQALAAPLAFEATRVIREVPVERAGQAHERPGDSVTPSGHVQDHRSPGSRQTLGTKV
jgi:hypothetical protein